MDEKLKFTLDELNSALENPYNELPPVVRRRVDALQNLHKQYLDVQKAYQAEVRELEKKYNKQFEPILNKRAQVVSGAQEPTEEEAKFERTLEEGAKLREAKPEDASIKGIPQFWLTVMQNNRMVSESIFENDEEALKALTDVRIIDLEGEKQNGFVVTFHFAENPYFTNSTLSITYNMEEEELFGELLFSSATGTKIDWKAGKNLTVKQIKKKFKGKGKGKPSRTMTVEEPQDSFFTLFTPPAITDEMEDAETAADVLDTAFDIGCIFKDKLVPYSLLWFTGEAAAYEDDYDDFDGEEDDFEGEEDEDEDEDEEEDEPPRKQSGGKGNARGGPGHNFTPPKGGAGAPGQPAQPECKQQ